MRPSYKRVAVCSDVAQVGRVACGRCWVTKGVRAVGRVRCGQLLPLAQWGREREMRREEGGGRDADGEGGGRGGWGGACETARAGRAIAPGGQGPRTSTTFASSEHFRNRAGTESLTVSSAGCARGVTSHVIA